MEMEQELISFGPGAEVRLTKPQGLGIFLTLVLLVTIGVIFQLSIEELLQLFVALSTAFFACMFCFSMFTALYGMKEGSLIEVSEEEIKQFLVNTNPINLPFVTVIVAAYKEAEVADQLVRSLSALKYPRQRLQVLIVLEENDSITVQAFRLALAQYKADWNVVIRPKGGAKTKPAAMNYLLQHGFVDPQSNITVVYDAEDQPETLQLLKAVVAFNKAWKDDSRVVCIQARLEFSQNAHEGWLQRMMSIDYLQHFGLVLPGLSKLGLVSPLGGTSNFILTNTLFKVGGWDERNVTEDLNLAVILSRLGYSVRVLDSVTSEEAVETIPAFIRQRSRWIKGGIQTYFRHMRNPLQLSRNLGVRGFLGFQMIVGAPLVLYLINPVFWGLTFAYAVTKSPAIEALYPPFIFYVAMFCFTVGNFLYIYLLLSASFRARKYSSVWFALMAPIYWILLSVAGYKAAWEFVRSGEKAQKWAKTQHKGRNP